MNKEKTIQVIKGVAIVLIIMALCFGLRAHAGDLSILSDDYQDYYRDSNGLPYFSEMDSYYNLRMTQDYIDHGYMGDIMLDNGTPMDMHRNSPYGVDTSGVTPMIAWTAMGLHNIINMFHSMSLTEVAFYAAAIISIIAVIPAYTLTRRITNNYGAIVAAILVCLGPNYFSHTFAGFFDTDMFNVFFPLFTFLFFTESVRSDNIIARIVYAILTVVSLLLFSLAWGGWYFYAFLLVAVAILYYLLGFILRIHSLRSFKNYSSKLKWFLDQKMLFSIVLIIIIGFIGLIIQGGGADTVVKLINDGFSLFGLQSTSGGGGGLPGTGFPNVMISVAEMQVPKLLYGGLYGAFLANSQSVINGIGGIIALFGALIVFAVYTNKVWKLRVKKVDEVKGKKSKLNRKSASQRKDESSKFSLALKELTNISSIEDKDKDRKLTLLYYSTFLAWIGVSAIAVTQGTRFIQVLLVPFGIVDGIFVGLAVDYIKAKVDNERVLAILTVFCSFLIAFPIAMQVNFMPGVVLFIILAAISLIVIYSGKFFKESNLSLKKTITVLLITVALIAPTVCAAYETSEQVVPGTSDPMWNSMTYLKTNANNTISNDTVVQSWWDFGYVFEFASDKQTYFDGGSQSGEGAFWTGRALTTSNLDLSKGIFTMLATTGTNATQVLNNYTGGNNSISVDILLHTLALPRDEAKNVMMSNYSLTEQEANNVLQYSHPENPRETVIVLSSDMLGKAGWWTYFGTWDFDAQNSSSLQYMTPTTVANISENGTGSINLLTENGIAFNAVLHRGVNGTNQTTTGQVEAVFESNNSTIYIDDEVYNPLKASNIMVIENNYLVKNESINGSEDGNYTLFVLGDGEIYNVILIDNKLVDSMFTKLFLLGGNGQDAYELVRIDSGVSLWKVNNDASSSTGTNTTS